MKNFPIVPVSGQVSLLISPSVTLPYLMEIAAKLAMQSQVLILDGGNCFDGFTLTRTLRSNTTDIQAVLERILLSRIFTCYQMATMLETCPREQKPLMVLDILSTFLDENVKLPIRKQLFRNCLAHLQHISRSAPVFVWARYRSSTVIDDGGMLDTLKDAADAIWHFETPEPVILQPSLFG
jgi:hypothetical protein